jgi:hypothetical protein
VPVQITENGQAVTNELLETFVTSTNPSVANSNPPTNNVALQTNMVFNPLVIPEYSVVRLEWTVLNVPGPTLELTASRLAQNLYWTGLSNVIYNVQGGTNLLGTWTTLGRVVNTTTQFSFTNWSSSPQEFYRLAIP